MQNTLSQLVDEYIELFLAEKPNMYDHPVDMTAEIGGVMAFSCEATGDPSPRYQWRKNGEIYQAGIGYDTNVLILDNVILNDAGVYYCEAINSVGTAESKKATLKVVGMCIKMFLFYLFHILVVLQKPAL